MTAPASTYEITPTPFPASTKTFSAPIHGIQTVATSTYFSDKILITVAQNGRLAHWVHVPLDISSTDNPFSSSIYHDDNTDPDLPSSDLLPNHHLTATSVLGGTVPELDTLGQLLATQIGSAITTRDPGEKRMLVMGMGLEKNMSGREEFSEVVGLVLGVL